MRVIEEKMVRAIKDRKDWNGGNTKVVQSSDHADVWLFGKHIATYVYETEDLVVDEHTLIAWPTPTTASRLNGLMRGLGKRDRVSVRMGWPFINDRVVL